MVENLPSRPVCDTFLYCFVVSVRPIYPLIHVPTFREDYNAFWHWCQHRNGRAPDQRLTDDPTFFLLLLSVLYVGAVVAPPGVWSDIQSPKTLDKDQTIRQLGTVYKKGLDQCQSLRHRSLNTLVAALLGRTFLKPPQDDIEDLAFVGTMVRHAQSMGLHRESADSDTHSLTSEIYRRVWWHIVSLDAQVASKYGTQTSCGTEGNQWNVSMVDGSGDEAFADPRLRFFTPRPASVSGLGSREPQSTLMLFTIGRYETARFKHKLLNRVHSSQSLTQADLNVFSDEYKSLHGTLSALIKRIPAQGLPEKGFVPSKLANASILTHEALYTEQSNEPSVFSSWARITLTMLSTGALLGLRKVLLNCPDLSPERREKVWARYVYHDSWMSYLCFFRLSLDPALTKIDLELSHLTRFQYPPA